MRDYSICLSTKNLTAVKIDLEKQEMKNMNMSSITTHAAKWMKYKLVVKPTKETSTEYDWQSYGISEKEEQVKRRTKYVQI